MNNKGPVLTILRVIKISLSIAFILFSGFPLFAQGTFGNNTKGVTLKFYLTVGHNWSQGVNGSLAALADYSPNEHLYFGAGIEGCTAGPQALMFRWNTGFQIRRVRIFFENQNLFNIYFRTHLKEYDAVELLGFSTKHWRVAIGVGQRLITRDKILDIDASTEYVCEPFNFMYDIQFAFAIDKGDRWRMTARIANFDDFVADRSFQPIISLKTSCSINDTFEAFARLATHPTGIFSMSAAYYEVFLNTGIVKKW